MIVWEATGAPRRLCVAPCGADRGCWYGRDALRTPAVHPASPERSRHVSLGTLPKALLSTPRASLSDQVPASALYTSLAPLYDTLVARRTDAEVDAIIGMIRAHADGAVRVIDLGCGTGRHGGRLANMGFTVVGVDLAPAMISVARRTWNRPRFVLGDWRTVRVSALFDVAVIMWSTLNYVSGAEDRRRLIDTLGWHVRDGGLVIIDVANQCGAPQSTSVHRIQERYARGWRVEIDRSVVGKLMFARYRYHLTSDEGDRLLLSDDTIARIYSVGELSVFGAPMLSPIVFYGDYELRPLDPAASPRVIAVYRKHGTDGAGILRGSAPCPGLPRSV